MLSEKEGSQLKGDLSFFKTAFENAINIKKELENTREALLYMMEDVNDIAFRIAKAGKDWEDRFDSNDDMIIVADKDYNIFKVNRVVAEVSGIRTQDIIGTKCYRFFHGTEEPCCKCPLNGIMDAGVQDIEEIEGWGQPERMFLVSTYPIFTKKGRLYGCLHIGRDITDIKRKIKTQEELDKKKREITTSLIESCEALSHTFESEIAIEETFSIGKKIIGFDFALYYQWDEKEGVFMPTASLGLDDSKRGAFLVRRFRIEDMGSSVVDMFVKKEGIIIIERGKEGSQDIIDLFDGFHPASLMLMPLKTAESFLGLIIEGYTSPNRFTSLKKEISRGMAHRIALMLDNARLYRESFDKVTDISKKIETITVMHEIDTTILSTLNRYEILNSVIRMTRRLIPCDAIVIATVDRYRKGFVREAGWGEDTEEDKFVPFKQTSCTRLLETGQSVFLTDFSKECPLLPMEKRLLKNGFRSILRVSLMIRDKVAGVLCLNRKRKNGVFTREDIFTAENIASQISVALENSWLVEDLKGLLLGTIESLASAIDAKSSWTKGHSERVTEYALMIGKEMGFNNETLKNLRLAALLHDVGKIGTYGLILDKPEKLLEEEFEIVKEHPVRGAEILTPIKQFKNIIPAIQYHHEFYDGRGYPEGLKGEDIPLLARILCVTDAYDSMTSDRPYRKAVGKKMAIKEIKRCSGAQFDPKVVDAFFKALEKSDGQLSINDCL